MKTLNVSKKGMTLIELMVALGVFSVLITIAAGIFVQSLKISRFTSAQSAAINNVALTVEEIAREVRTGYGFTPTQDPTTSIDYINYKQEHIYYAFSTDNNKNEIVKSVTDKDGNITIPLSGVTDPSIKVTGSFYVNNNSGKSTPRITIVADVTDSNNSPLVHIQTSISARLIYYK